MRKATFTCLILLMLAASLTGCGSQKIPKIGVSLGVGSASRWEQEKTYMEERAGELGVEIEVRLNTAGEDVTQMEECIELINSGIDVLIMRPKNTDGIEDVIQLAQQKKVKLINYAGLVDQQPIDLFVGYDCVQIGATLGQYLSEMVPTGDYILLSGDPDDKYVSPYLFEGAMKYLDPIKGDINVILNASVPGWNPEEAKRMVQEAVVKNGNQVDAILAPNDVIAGACAEVIAELGITEPVVITGMDAQLDAVKRIVAGTQSCTVYMDGRTLANTAVDAAVKMAKGEKLEANAEINNGSSNPIPSQLINSKDIIPANLISGQLVIKENVDKKLIESKYYTREEVYGTP